MDIIYRVSLEYSLHLNPNKCIARFFGSVAHREELSLNVGLSINGTQLPLKDKAKDLGLIIDTSLRFDKHISGCIKRAMTRLKILYNARHILNTEIRILLCDSFILSIFN